MQHRFDVYKAWAVFGLRFLLGALFFVAGLLKVGAVVSLAAIIAGFRLLPAGLVGPLALFLPFFEIGLGGYLLLGLFTRYVAIIAMAQLLVFAAAIASVVVRGIVTSCGCFGPADTAPATWLDVVRDLALAGFAGFIAWAAPGKLALDYQLEQRSTSSL